MSDQSQTGQAPVIVFLIEDEALIQELLHSPLEEAGFKVLVASSSDEARGLLESGVAPEPRVLVTDIDLRSPQTGWDVARYAREVHPEICVVYMTGAHADEWPAQGVPNSILITKPFAPAQVITAVSQLLNTTSTPQA